MSFRSKPAWARAIVGWSTTLVALLATMTPVSEGGLAADHAGATVRIGVFGLFRPQELVVRPAPGSVLVIRAGTETFELEGARRARLRLAGNSVECAAGGRLVSAGAVQVAVRSSTPDSGGILLSVPGKLERRFRGTLAVSAGTSEVGVGGRGRAMLVAVVTMDLETAVASAVAAESPPGAPLEALKAQAVATRSYYVAQHGRHRQFDFCDTTHCQFLRAPPATDDPASQAAAATRGLVLAYHGAPLAAFYSASCGGRTRTVAEARLPDDGYPYFAVDCAYCLRHAKVRMRSTGTSGFPAGHGIGLCQEGARGMAEAGADFREILVHYYPNTSLAAATLRE